MGKEAEDKCLAVIIMGSEDDKPHVDKIVKTLRQLRVDHAIRVASAHKTPHKALQIVEEYEKGVDHLVFIAVAGRSNALGGFLDGATPFPVISCPPYSEKFGGLDILSSLRMPSGIGAMTVLEPEAAALAAAKILALANPELMEYIIDLQRDNTNKVRAADKRLSIQVQDLMKS